MEKEMNSNKQSNSENYSSSQTATQPLQFSCLVKLFFSLLNNIKNFLKETFYFAIRLGIAIAFIWLIINVINLVLKKDSLVQNSSIVNTPSSASPKYVRPPTAPSGHTWPLFASYVDGFQSLHTEGLSTVTISNIQNDSDVFVKLMFLDKPQAYPVRHFFIPAFGKFTLEKVTAGNYDIRYRDLSNGKISRTEAFNLKETTTKKGTQFSNITMTLFKVSNGNMQTYDLSEAEF